MAMFFILFGVVLVVAGTRNTQGTLWTLLEGDFTGSGNFVYWFLSILVIGARGYIKPLRPFANMLLALLIVVLLISNQGFFDKFQQAISDFRAIKPTPSLPAGSAQSTTASSSGVQLPVTVTV